GLAQSSTERSRLWQCWVFLEKLTFHSCWVYLKDWVSWIDYLHRLAMIFHQVLQSTDLGRRLLLRHLLPLHRSQSCWQKDLLTSSLSPHRRLCLTKHCGES